MTVDNYLDFILLADEVETRPDGSIEKFKVMVFDSPAGQSESKVPVNVPEGIVDAVGFLASRAHDNNIESQIDLGEQLAGLLLPESVRKLFENSLNRLRSNQGLRLWLRLADELTDFPWEYMYIQTARGERNPSSFLALDPRISIVRHLNLAEPVDWFETGSSFFAPPSRRVIVAMASPEPYNEWHPMLKDLPIEQKKLKQRLSNVPGLDTVYIPEYNGPYQTSIPGARMEEIFDALIKRQTDIFHFSGHGDYSGALELADQQNKIILVDPDRFAETLQGNGVRLAVMGACHTGRRDGRNVWTGTAASLLKVGIPAVLAMQFPIYDDLSAEFMNYFYARLVAGQTLDEAVAAGRKAIRVATISNDIHLPDWGVPVLYLRSHNSRIFQPVDNKDIRSQLTQLSDMQARLYHIWWGWDALGETASTLQLDNLALNTAAIDIPPVQLVLLLRSNLEQNRQSSPWIDRLRKTGAEYIQELDDPQAPKITASQAVSLLGLDEQTQTDRPAGIGPVTWAAMQHKNHITRLTAALSITAIQPAPETGLGRLQKALNKIGGRWSLRRWNLQSELHGALVDADHTLESMPGHLPPVDRIGVWFWRFRQRLYRDRERIAFLVLGSALGAGLALGLWRGLIAAIAPAQSIAIRFAISFFWGAILGGCVGLGIGLARPLLVGNHERNLSVPDQISKTGRPEYKVAWMAIALGTIFFGVAHIFVALSNGLPLETRWFVLITGVITGLGINLALYGQPNSDKGLSLVSWLLRLVIAASLAILAQWMIFAIQPLLPQYAPGDEFWAVSSITRRGGSYADYFANFQDLSAWLLSNQNRVSYFDSVIVNMLMTIGIALGLSKAMEWLTRWTRGR